MSVFNNSLVPEDILHYYDNIFNKENRFNFKLIEAREIIDIIKNISSNAKGIDRISINKIKIS